MTAEADVAKEVAEKTQVIAHLTKTLAKTRECLEIARAALDRIANEAALAENPARCREIAADALKQI